MALSSVVERRLRFGCRIMSHRGGALEWIENTMLGFRHSAALGVDLLELDVIIHAPLKGF